MSFHELTFLELVCCPVTEHKLGEIEPWLYGSRGSDALYPKLCDTPVLQPHVDHFLKAEALNISRAFAELQEVDYIKDWFYSRYGWFNPPEPIPMDTEIMGEGYPGFWDVLLLPDFIEAIKQRTPETAVLDCLGEARPQLALDMGCGQGGMTQQMAECCGQVLGLEANFYLAATANRLLKSSDIPIRYFVPEQGYQTTYLKKKSVDNAYVICGDITAPPFCEPLFDWVHLGHVLDLLDEPTSVVTKVLQIMKPGGILSICTPWDFPFEGHFDGLLEMLSQEFRDSQQVDGLPWVRFQHKRRFLLHEDWIWVGRLKA